MIALAIKTTLFLVVMFFVWEVMFYLFGMDDSNNEDENKYPLLQKIVDSIKKYKILDLLFIFTIIYGNLKIVNNVMNTQVDLIANTLLIALANLFTVYVWLYFNYNLRIFNFKFKVPFGKK